MTENASTKKKSPAPPPRLTAGGEIDAWCTKCKMDLGHRIVAMVGPTPKRVVCMTCGSEHNYRQQKGVTAPLKATPRKAAAPTKKALAAAQAQATWESRMKSGGTFKRYMITETFEEGDLIDHKKFGRGYVMPGASEGKVTVVFEDGERTLVQGAR